MVTTLNSCMILLDIFALSLDYENQAIEVALGIGRKLCMASWILFSPQSKCSSDGTSEILHHAIGDQEVTH